MKLTELLRTECIGVGSTVDDKAMALCEIAALAKNSTVLNKISEEAVLEALDGVGGRQENPAPLQGHLYSVAVEFIRQPVKVLRVQFPESGAGHRGILAGEMGSALLDHLLVGGESVPVRVVVHALPVRQGGAAHLRLKPRGGRPQDESLGESGRRVFTVAPGKNQSQEDTEGRRKYV